MADDEGPFTWRDGKLVPLTPELARENADASALDFEDHNPARGSVGGSFKPSSKTERAALLRAIRPIVWAATGALVVLWALGLLDDVLRTVMVALILISLFFPFVGWQRHS